MYKLINNKLNTNNRLAHFESNIASNCGYCMANYFRIRERNLGPFMGPVPIYKETYLHLFFECIYADIFWKIGFGVKETHEKKELFFSEPQ